MKRILGVWLLATLMTGSAAAQESRAFVRGGVGASMYWLENSDDTDPMFSFSGGVGYDAAFKNSRWGLRTELSAVLRGARVEYFDGYGGSYGRHWQHTNVNAYYGQLSMDATCRFDLGSWGALKLAFGPYAAYGIGGKTKVPYDDGHRRLKVDTFGDDGLNLRRFDAGLSTGVILEFERFFVGLDYDFGFVPVYGENTYGETGPCNYSGQLSVGVYF